MFKVRVWSKKRNDYIYASVEDIIAGVGWEYGIEEDVLDFASAVKEGEPVLFPTCLVDDTCEMVYPNNVVKCNGSVYTIMQSGVIFTCEDKHNKVHPISILNGKQLKILGDTKRG